LNTKLSQIVSFALCFIKKAYSSVSVTAMQILARNVTVSVGLDVGLEKFLCPWPWP